MSKIFSSGPLVNRITSQATSGVSRVQGFLLIFNGLISSIEVFNRSKSKGHGAEANFEVPGKAWVRSAGFPEAWQE